MQIEKITWEADPPDEFPCMVCDKNKAEWRGKFQHKGVTVSLCLCNICVNLPESELMERIFGNTDIISDIKKHKERHIFLHKCLDELLTDFIKHTEKLPSKTPISDLMEWSYKETKEPTE